MPLRACMESHTHREFLTWQQYFNEEWDEQTKLDNYLAQIAQTIANAAQSKRRRRFSLSDFLLKFRLQRTLTEEEQLERVTKQAKQTWFARTMYEEKKDG